jgi:hypothetical protein
MSRVGRHRPENEWGGAGRSARLHGPPFSAREAGCLDGLGAAGPDLKQTKSAEWLSLNLSVRR